MKPSFAFPLLLLAVSAAAWPWHRAEAECVGDCNRNGRVTAEEIVFGTDILLNATLLPQCDSFDANGDDAVGKDEIVASVTNALDGCPIVPGCGNGCVEFALGETCDDGGVCRGGARNGQRCNQSSSQGCDNNPCADGVCVPVDGDRVSADACPSSCRISSCNTASGTVDVEIDFTVPGGVDITSTTIFLRYPDGIVRIPGSSGGQTVQDRLSVPSGAIFTPNDLDYALQVLLFQGDGSSPIPAPELFTVQFDKCQGAPPPNDHEFDCVVLDATDTSLRPVTGMQCSATVKP